MEFLEQIWEAVSGIFSALAHGFERTLTSVFGSSNARFVRKLQPKVEAIAALEPKMRALSNEELRGLTAEFRKRLAAGEHLDNLLVEAFAAARESGRRHLNMRHFDVQLIGGMILHAGNIAEMVTGEGKTLVATLPAYLNALSGKGVHVVTVNDYLARRDMEWMGPLYIGLGMTVGAIQSGMDAGERQASYACDITYGTNNEFGFDYLRDNMRPAARGDNRYPKQSQQAQGPLHFAIIDEVDNILIDEARTPLIIAGPAHGDVSLYSKADKIARQLVKDVDFEVKEKEHSVHLTDEGVRKAEHLAGVETFYSSDNMEWPHLIDNALKAHHLYKRDVNYVVMDDEIVIVDEFTGRLMPGRNWSDGLHQAVEAKEGVTVKEENQTLATITLQNFFKLYDRLCGMTGTAMTEASEFWKIYKLDVIAVPTNRKMQRLNFPDVIFRSVKEKFHAIADEIERMHKWDVVALKDKTEHVGTIVSENDSEIEFQARDSKQREKIPRANIVEMQKKGRPVLVGTVSIERSEHLSALLDRRGIKHEVLNAKQHKREAEIVAQAGRLSAVTIATNMAGRGTDIILGGNAETMAWALLQDKYATRLDVPKEEWSALVHEIEQREKMKAQGDEVRKLGGLHIIGSERHEARRIDLQLRGRCGRQGDPGSSRFFLSLEDDLMRIFAGEWVKNVLTRMGMQEGEAIESRMVSRRVEGAQKKVEERNFDQRKNLLEYDEVMDEQRKRVYSYRQDILNGANGKLLILAMIDEQIDRHFDSFLAKDYGAETFAQWAGRQLGVELEARDFRGLDYVSAERVARDQAERSAEVQVFDAIDENLPEGEENEPEWNWEALTKLVNTRWKLNYRDRDLKKIHRNELAEVLQAQAKAALDAVDLSEGARFLQEKYGVATACGWMQYKFGVKLDPAEMARLDLPAFKAKAHDIARQAYDEKEIEFPVMAGLHHFTTRDSGGQKRYDRDAIVQWARDRFAVEITVDDLKNMQREEIHDKLIEHSRQHQQQAVVTKTEADRRLTPLVEGLADDVPLSRSSANGRVNEFSDWLNSTLGSPLTSEKLATMNRAELAKQIDIAVDDRFSPEIRRMERTLILEILDTAWKDHLLAMDHLKSSVGLRGYAQVDPKVEYKREGMRTYELMWQGVYERVTDFFFRMEQMNEDFVGSVWTETAAIHEESAPTMLSAAAGSSAGGHRQHRRQAQAGTDPQPRRTRRPQRSLSLRQRQEIQELPHAQRRGLSQPASTVLYH